MIVFLASRGPTGSIAATFRWTVWSSARRARAPAVPGLGAGIFETGTYPAANECQFPAAPIEWPRSAAGSNQEKFGGKAMTEKTVRCRSVLRRTMLVGTAGVLGGAVLRATPVQSQTGTAPAVAIPGSSPPGSRYGDPAWWAQRKEEILEPALEIVDPHHHLWDRKEHRYLLDQLLADTGSAGSYVRRCCGAVFEE